MANLRYSRLGWRWRRMRGFRLQLHSSRCTIHRRIHVKLLSFLHRLTGCLKLKPLKGGYRRSLSRRGLVICEQDLFYAEAIADCLEFIKRSSLPVDDGSTATYQH